MADLTDLHLWKILRQNRALNFTVDCHRFI